MRHVASVRIPAVGPVAFWYGRARQGGWCAGLRLREGNFLGTKVVGGRFFLLAIRHPRRHVLPMHLAALDEAGNLVAKGRSPFGC